MENNFNELLATIPTEELLKEVVKRNDVQKYECGLYQGYELKKKYTSPEPDIPKFYYAVIIPHENFHISSE